MNETIELAHKLGKMIAQSPQAQKLHAARAELNKDIEATNLLQQFQDQAARIGKLEEENKPVEVEDKHKLQDLQRQLVAREVFKKFTAAQVEYVDLMRQVNQALQQELAATEV